MNQPPSTNHLLKTHWITTSILVICIGLFAIQVLTGVSPSDPTHADLITWGANGLFYSFSAQPWRMLTSVFLHIGFVHIAFNMFALYLYGQDAEGLFGHGFYLSMFLLAGIGGNVLNNSISMHMLLQHQSLPAISAGASGGIMGIGAGLLVCGLFKIPFPIGLFNTKALIYIMGINLMLGFIMPNIDNAGHIGGALVGALMAFIFALFYHYVHKKAIYHTRAIQIMWFGKTLAILLISGLLFFISQYFISTYGTDLLYYIQG